MAEDTSYSLDSAHQPGASSLLAVAAFDAVFMRETNDIHFPDMGGGSFLASLLQVAGRLVGKSFQERTRTDILLNPFNPFLKVAQWKVELLWAEAQKHGRGISGRIEFIKTYSKELFKKTSLRELIQISLGEEMVANPRIKVRRFNIWKVADYLIPKSELTTGPNAILAEFLNTIINARIISADLEERHEAISFIRYTLDTTGRNPKVTNHLLLHMASTINPKVSEIMAILSIGNSRKELSLLLKYDWRDSSSMFLTEIQKYLEKQTRFITDENVKNGIAAISNTLNQNTYTDFALGHVLGCELSERGQNELIEFHNLFVKHLIDEFTHAKDESQRNFLYLLYASYGMSSENQSIQEDFIRFQLSLLNSNGNLPVAMSHLYVGLNYIGAQVQRREFFAREFASFFSETPLVTKCLPGMSPIFIDSVKLMLTTATAKRKENEPEIDETMRLKVQEFIKVLTIGALREALGFDSDSVPRQLRQLNKIASHADAFPRLIEGLNPTEINEIFDLLGRLLTRITTIPAYTVSQNTQLRVLVTNTVSIAGKLRSVTKKGLLRPHRKWLTAYIASQHAQLR